MNATSAQPPQKRTGGLPTNGAIMNYSSFGPTELFVTMFVVMVLLAVTIWPAWRTAGKTGNSPVLGLGLLVPGVNLIVILYLAFSEWPIERELKRHRGEIS